MYSSWFSDINVSVMSLGTLIIAYGKYSQFGKDGKRHATSWYGYVWIFISIERIWHDNYHCQIVFKTGSKWMYNLDFSCIILCCVMSGTYTSVLWHTHAFSGNIPDVRCNNIEIPHCILCAFWVIYLSNIIIYYNDFCYTEYGDTPPHRLGWYSNACSMTY